MPITAFLLGSSGPGDLRVGRPSAEPAESDADVEAVLHTLDGDARLDCPGVPPPTDWPAAVWAARSIYGLAQALTFRDLSEDFLRQLARAACPSPVSAAACWSVDLSFCLLPDLHRLASAASHDDPLTLGLAEVGRRWPLSSVGMAGVGETDVSIFWPNPGLRQLYVDRVIRRGDKSRLADARVKAAVAAALGVHRSLAPVIAMSL